MGDIIMHHMGDGITSPCGLHPSMVYRGLQAGFSTEWAEVECAECLAKKPGAKVGVGAPTPQNYYLTFGVKYSRETHPHWAGAHPDGWVRIIADTYEDACHVARQHFGPAYAFIYEALRFEPRWHPNGEIATVVQDKYATPTRWFTRSSPEYYGRDHAEVVGHRIEGVLKHGSDKDAVKELGYEVGMFHTKCADEGRAMFKIITEEDSNVLAFELDWAVPVSCDYCEESLT